MLKGIIPCISPELLKTRAKLGHGDKIILADAHFSGHILNACVLRADGLGIATLLEGILPILKLDSYAPPLAMMAAVPGDKFNPNAEASYLKVIRKHVPSTKRLSRSSVSPFMSAHEKLLPWL